MCGVTSQHRGILYAMTFATCMIRKALVNYSFLIRQYQTVFDEHLGVVNFRFGECRGQRHEAYKWVADGSQILRIALKGYACLSHKSSTGRRSKWMKLNDLSNTRDCKSTVEEGNLKIRRNSGPTRIVVHVLRGPFRSATSTSAFPTIVLLIPIAKLILNLLYTQSCSCRYSIVYNARKSLSSSIMWQHNGPPL